MARILKMAKPTATEHKTVMQLVDEAIDYHKYIKSGASAAAILASWREKYKTAYDTAAEK